MDWSFLFFFNSILFGIGLAMDAFSVSLVNGFNEPHMRKRRILLIAGVFGFFQAAMPLIGYAAVRFMATAFQAFEPFIPYIALALLLYLGIRMIVEGIRKKGETEAACSISKLLLQGLATSIDALSVGFTIAHLNTQMALVESLLIGGVTFLICVAGILLGKVVGTKLKDKATIVGGIILCAIGLEIFLTGIFG